MGQNHEATPQTEDRLLIQVVGGKRRDDDAAARRPKIGWVLVAAAVTAVAVISFGDVAFLTSGDDAAGSVIPDFSQDVTLVGEALTAAYSSGDVDLYLGLFAADAELEFNAHRGPLVEMLTLADYRESIVGWSQTMNERWQWVDCQRTGNVSNLPALCQVRVTSDWLELMAEEPDRGRVTLLVVDGGITQWEYRGLRSPSDDAVARFEDWTREHNPDEAAAMWAGGASIIPIFTEESARLHLQLGLDFVTQASS